MGQKELLFAFEDKYRFLYDIEVNGVLIYTCLRDGVCARLQGNTEELSSVNNEKGRIFIRRVIDSGRKIYRFRKKKTLIFTSSVYRRDKGRNLAAEYLMQKYPDAVVFEWPSRNEVYDASYFTDDNKDKYCPLELYLVIYKLYIRIFRKQYSRLYEECKDTLVSAFANSYAQVDEHEHKAIEYLMTTMPESYAITTMSQAIFKKLFRKYRQAKYAIDFWGSARENIIPVLQGNPESIELQHGVITSSHPGYVYPEFVRGKQPFFQRCILVYGRSTKDILCNNSIFEERKVDIIGNPRIKMYLEEHRRETQERKYLLFTSQPYEQDFGFSGYYDTVFEFLRELKECIHSNVDYSDYKIAIKLHPRENENIKKRYAEVLGDDVEYFGSDKDLYGLLSQTFIHFTVNSTVLYEAAEFGCPTIIFPYGKFDMKQMFGEHIRIVSTKQGMVQCLEELSDVQEYDKYLKYLVQITKEFM